jgi:hypothetical protein
MAEPNNQQEPKLDISYTQLQELMKTMIQEMKKPTEVEQAKLDAEAKKLKAQQDKRLELQKAEVTRRVTLKAKCPHGTTHPGTGAFSHAWRAQVNTPAGEPPFFIPTCQQCQTQLKKIYATPDQVRDGVQLHVYPNLNVAVLERWADESAKAIA